MLDYFCFRRFTCLNTMWYVKKAEKMPMQAPAITSIKKWLPKYNRE